MKKRNDPLGDVAALQADRVLRSSPGFDALPAEKRTRLQARLTEAYASALANQPGFDAESALLTLQEDGLAADFLNEVKFPKFVGDLLKGVFDANIATSIRQMEAYAELLKAVNASLASFVREVSDKEAHARLGAGAGTAPSAKELRSAKLAIAREQRRLLRQILLIGLARLAVKPRTSAATAFLGIRPGRDQFDFRLREKVIRRLCPRPKAAPALRSGPPAAMTRDVPALAAAAAPAGELSGRVWTMRFPGSQSVDTLEPGFRNNLNRFLAALAQARVNIRISATFRPPERAYLMHWSWKISRGIVTGEAVPPFPRPGVVNIIWWHGNPEDTKRAATEMVQAYGIGGLGVAPALASRHTEGKAIDMSLSWAGPLTIRRADGAPVTIAAPPADGTNPQLIEVGKTYNVIHFLNVLKDKPHWSTDGR